MKIYKFTTTWCAPCKAMASRYELLKKEFLNNEYLDIDCEKQTDLVEKYEIVGIPFFIVLDKDIEILRTNSLEKLQELLSTESDWS